MSLTRFTGSALALIAAAGSFAPTAFAQTPDGLTPTEWTSLRAAYEQGRHRVFEKEDGTHQARTHRQSFSTRFDARGATVSADEGAWEFGLEFMRYGFEGHEVEVLEPQRTDLDGRRLSYVWDDSLTEWYVNRDDGLEHGFTVRDRPEGSGNGRALQFDLRLLGDLVPSVDNDGLGVSLFDVRGEPVATYAGLVVTDARGHELEARITPRQGGISIVVDESDALYPLTVDPIVQQAYLKASSTTHAVDFFGDAVAVSGDTVVVGARFEDSGATGVDGNQADNSAIESGAVYVFVRSGTKWTQQAYLKASNTDSLDYFGDSVAVSGDTIVVGALFEDGNATGVDGNQADNSASTAGAAYVFVRSGATWTQQAYLKASNTDSSNLFGISVDLSGNTVVVGASSEESNATGVDGNEADNSAIQAGAAYVFVRSGTTWTQQAYLKASNTDAADGFGESVAVSGDTVVVSAYREASGATGVDGNQADNSAHASGAAYIFVRSGTTWTQQAYLKASNTASLDRFGDSVAVSGDTVVVGAWSEDSFATGVNGNQADNSASSSGAAYVFVRLGTIWTQQAYLKASNPGQSHFFGTSVAVLGDTIVVGADGESSNATGVDGNQADSSALGSGAVYVFVRSGTTWTQQAYLKASNAASFDFFGDSVAFSGDTLVVGAFYEDSNATGVNGNQADNSDAKSGAAYIFVRSGTTWTQQAYLKASSTTHAGDGFGESVAISGDTVVVGAPFEGSNTTGVDGDQANNSASFSGAVYVFVRSGTTWTQQAYLKASNTEVGDTFGDFVAISGDTVVVGAEFESSFATGVDGNQADNSAPASGAAYVFVRSGTTWTQQAYLKASGTDAGDHFGRSVAVAGDTIVVGANDEDSFATGVDGNQADNSASASGAAYVFVRSGTTWTQQAYLKASNTDASDAFGFHVGVSGDTVVVGAWGESGNATGVDGNRSDNSVPQAGAAYVFARSGTTWTQQAYLKASNTEQGDVFGVSVAISGDTIVVAAQAEDSSASGVDGDQSDNSASFSGAAYVFVRSGPTWVQQAYLKASNTEQGDVFGVSVAISGDTIVVGANGEDSSATGVDGNQTDNIAPQAGAAYVFARSGRTWTQLAYLKASNTEQGDVFGKSVAVSGATVVVGAPFEGSSTTGVDGNQADNSASDAGAVYVFDLDPDWCLYPGCFGNTASYVIPQVPAQINTTVPVSLLGSVVSNGVVATYYGAIGVDASGCGIQLAPTEELLLALTPFPTLYGLSVMTGGVATTTLNLPNEPGIVGFQVALQSVAIDTTTFNSEYSNALEFVIRP